MNGDDVFLLEYDFINGVILLVDKLEGWIFFDVVNKIRYRLKYWFKVKKIKVGYVGILDFMVIGLLIICIGKVIK